jgi:hypothetical protein
MKRDLPDRRSLAWPAEQVEHALARVEASAAFRGLPRLRIGLPVGRVRGETTRRRARAAAGA